MSLRPDPVNLEGKREVDDDSELAGLVWGRRPIVAAQEHDLGGWCRNSFQRL
jgi:hypothetical protein